MQVFLKKQVWFDAIILNYFLFAFLFCKDIFLKTFKGESLFLLFTGFHPNMNLKSDV